MAKFYGSIGYSVTKETTPGVWTDTVVERSYTGDVLKSQRPWRDSGNVNPDVAISDVISVIADGFMLENRYSMKYIKWKGATLEISNVSIERPRAIISIGGVFNGRTSNADV